MATETTRHDRHDWDDIIGETFDLLADSPEGVTLEQIQLRNSCEPHVARIAIARLRDALGDDGGANVMVRTNGRQRLYVLAGEGADVLGDDGAWLSFNQKYVETRLTTVRTVYKSLLRSIANEAQAEACRRLVKNLDRLIEDIAEVHA